MVNNFLQPDNFKDDIYSWSTNQISHTTIALLLTWIVSVKFFYFVIGFWALIELYQYIFLKSKILDTIEDLFFEISGCLILINEKIIYLTMTVFLILFCCRYYKIKRGK